MSRRGIFAVLSHAFVASVLAFAAGLAASEVPVAAAPSGMAEKSPEGSLARGATVGLEVGSAVSGAVSSPATQVRRFWVKDKHFYYSDWYAGRHRKMIPFGCTRAPFYDPDPRCARQRGFHHGLDVAMACRNKLYAGYRTRVVDPASAGSLGGAYGPHAFRLRSARFDKDFVIGHVRRVFVEPGDRVRRGELIALASDAGAPDGCHLHFEVRPVAAGYQSAVAPYRFIDLRRSRR